MHMLQLRRRSISPAEMKALLNLPFNVEALEIRGDHEIIIHVKDAVSPAVLEQYKLQIIELVKTGVWETIIEGDGA